MQTVTIKIYQYCGLSLAMAFAVPARIIGDIAVHRSVFWFKGQEPRESNRYRTVTHIPSGLSVERTLPPALRSQYARVRDLAEWARRFQILAADDFATMRTEIDRDGSVQPDTDRGRRLLDIGTAISLDDPEPSPQNCPYRVERIDRADYSKLIDSHHRTFAHALARAAALYREGHSGVSILSDAVTAFAHQGRKWASERGPSPAGWSMSFRSDGCYKSRECIIGELAGIRYASHRRGYHASNRAIRAFAARVDRRADYARAA